MYEKGIQWLLELGGDLGRLAWPLSVVRLGIALGGSGNRVRDQIDVAHASAVEADVVTRVILVVHWRGYFKDYDL